MQLFYDYYQFAAAIILWENTLKLMEIPSLKKIQSNYFLEIMTAWWH